VVYKYTRDGKLLRRWEKRCVRATTKSTDAFNGLMMSLSPDGDIFISDGDYNSRVVHFSKDGNFIKIWRHERIRARSIRCPHAIAIDSKTGLLVLDEQVTRITLAFRCSIKWPVLQQWTNIGLKLPTGLAIAADDTVYIGILTVIRSQSGRTEK